jgi:hypothetical protein
MKKIDGVLTSDELASGRVNLVMLASGPGGVGMSIWRRALAAWACRSGGAGIGPWRCLTGWHCVLTPDLRCWLLPPQVAARPPALEARGCSWRSVEQKAWSSWWRLQGAEGGVEQLELQACNSLGIVRG